MSGLSEKQLQEFRSLSSDEQGFYANLRRSEISHQNALDLIAKWRTEDESVRVVGTDEDYRESLGTPGYDAGIEVGGTSPFPTDR